MQDISFLHERFELMRYEHGPQMIDVTNIHHHSTNKFSSFNQFLILWNFEEMHLHNLPVQLCIQAEIAHMFQ